MLGVLNDLGREPIHLWLLRVFVFMGLSGTPMSGGATPGIFMPKRTSQFAGC
jgi:hypothetical protein